MHCLHRVLQILRQNLMLKQMNVKFCCKRNLVMQVVFEIMNLQIIFIYQILHCKSNFILC